MANFITEKQQQVLGFIAWEPNTARSIRIVASAGTEAMEQESKLKPEDGRQAPFDSSVEGLMQ